MGSSITSFKLSSSYLEAFLKYAMSWLSPPSNEVLISKCLLNWCKKIYIKFKKLQKPNLYKFSLEFQKYHQADRDTILRFARPATDTY